MQRESKIRIAIISLFFIVFLYFSIGYIYELYCLDLKSLLSADNGSISIDGSDFTPIFTLFGAGISSFICLLTAASYALVIAIVSILLLVPFRLIALNKKRLVTNKEYLAVKKIFLSAIVLSLLVGGILSRFALLIPLLVFNSIWSVFTYIFCVLPMKAKIAEVK